MKRILALVIVFMMVGSLAWGGVVIKGAKVGDYKTTFEGYQVDPNMGNNGIGSTVFTSVTPSRGGVLKAIYWKTYGSNDDTHHAALYDKNFKRLELSSTTVTNAGATTLYKFECSGNTIVNAGDRYYAAISSSGSWDSGRYAFAVSVVYWKGYTTGVECPDPLVPAALVSSTANFSKIYIEVYG